MEKQHGIDAPRYIAEQIGQQVICGDEAGVEKWKAVSLRYAELAGGDDRSGTLGTGGTICNH